MSVCAYIHAYITHVSRIFAAQHKCSMQILRAGQLCICSSGMHIIYVYIHVYIHTHTHTYMHTYIHVHTHIHTHTYYSHPSSISSTAHVHIPTHTYRPNQCYFLHNIPKIHTKITIFHV